MVAFSIAANVFLALLVHQNKDQNQDQNQLSLPAAEASVKTNEYGRRAVSDRKNPTPIFSDSDFQTEIKIGLYNGRRAAHASLGVSSASTHASHLRKGSIESIVDKENRVMQLKLQEAAAILQSIGLDELCHPSSNALYPFFRRCDMHLGSKDFALEQETTLYNQKGCSETQRQLHDEEVNTITNSEEDRLGSNDVDFYLYNGIMAFICVATAALAAGLTLGLLSLDPLNLLIKMRTASSEEEKRQAASLLPIVRQHHLLLVTLLLLNSMANEALPLFLDKVVPGYLAIILSVTLVLFFGEIIPSAIFTGPQRIKIASQLAPIVRLVMCLLYPIAFPISKLLDTLLHDDEADGGAFTRGELSALVRIQYEERLAVKKKRKEEKMMVGRNYSILSDDSGTKAVQVVAGYDSKSSIRMTKRNHFQQSHELPLGMNSKSTAGDNSESIPIRPEYTRPLSLHFDEVTMIQGALEMKTKKTIEVYLPMRNVFSIPHDTILTEQKIVEIYSSGFSRVPVYKVRPGKEKDKTGVVGVLLTKQLMVVSNTDERPVSTLPLQVPYCVSPTMNLVDLISLFQTRSSGNKGGHLAIVCARPLLAQQALDAGDPIPEKAGTMGLVTLEDCLEELLQKEIYDEMDKTEIAQLRVAKWAWQKWKLFVKQKKLSREQRALDPGRNPALRDVVKAATAVLAAESGEDTPLLPCGHSKTENSDRKFFFGLF